MEGVGKIYLIFDSAPQFFFICIHITKSSNSGNTTFTICYDIFFIPYLPLQSHLLPYFWLICQQWSNNFLSVVTPCMVFFCTFPSLFPSSSNTLSLRLLIVILLKISLYLFVPLVIALPIFFHHCLRLGLPFQCQFRSCKSTLHWFYNQFFNR